MAWGGAAEGALSGAAAGGATGDPYGAAAGGLFGGVMGFFQGKKQKKFNSKQKRAIKKYERNVKKLHKQQEKSTRKYNREYYGGRFGEKAYNKKLEKFYKKYGEEKVTNYDILNKGQKGLLGDITRGGRKNLGKFDPLNELSDINLQRGYRQGKHTLQDLMENPGISDIRNSGIYQQGRGALEDILQNPGISDIQGMQGYQQGQGALNDLLSQNPEAYQRFAQPLMDQFQQEQIPELIGRFGGGGKSSSALNNALGTAAKGLYSNLGSIKAGLIPGAIGQQLQYSQAPLSSEQARANILGAGAGQALEYGNAPLRGQELSASIRGTAAQNALPYATERAKYNLGGYGAALDQSRLGLGTQGFGTQYRAPLAPTASIVTGGRLPTNKFAPLPPSQPVNKPGSGFQQFGSQVLEGLGKSVGENAYSNLSGLFSGGGGGGGAPSSQSWGFNQLGGKSTLGGKMAA